MPVLNTQTWKYLSCKLGRVLWFKLGQFFMQTKYKQQLSGRQNPELLKQILSKVRFSLKRKILLIPHSGGRGRLIAEFKASLVYRASSKTARAIQRNPISNYSLFYSPRRLNKNK